MYKAVIFDFFDVIHRDPFKKWLQISGLERERDFEDSSRLVDLGHISEAEFHKRLSRSSGHSLESIERIFNERDVVDKNMVQLIEKLHGRYKIGLLTNSSSEYLRPLLHYHNINDLFDEVVVSSEVELIKPSIDIFHYILRKLETKPDETLFIDDNIHNVKAANSLGIHSIAFTDHKSLKQELHKLKIVTK